jgi:hypothetical protein
VAKLEGEWSVLAIKRRGDALPVRVTWSPRTGGAGRRAWLWRKGQGEGRALPCAVLTEWRAWAANVARSMKKTREKGWWCREAECERACPEGRENGVYEANARARQDAGDEPGASSTRQGLRARLGQASYGTGGNDIEEPRLRQGTNVCEMGLEARGHV